MDIAIFNLLHTFAGQSGFLDSLIIFFAKHLPYFFIALTVYFIAKRKLWREKVFAFITVLLTPLLAAGVITKTIRFFYDRPRPFKALSFEPLLENASPAFPSGHASFLFALAFAIMYFDRRAGFWFLALATLNSLARVSAGLHWPSDIVGGVLVAAVSFGVVQKLLKQYRPTS